MTDEQAALKSLEGKMQVSESGLLFVDGKALIKFSEDGSTHQTPRQQSKSDSQG